MQIAPDPSAARRSILIVDDDDPLREALRILLAGEGFRPLVAADGAEALERRRVVRPYGP